MRHGLGTNDEVEAERLVEQLNELLVDEGWWSADRRDEAALRFDGLVVSIFFDRIEVGEVDPKSLREQHIRLPFHRGRVFQGDASGNDRGGKDYVASPSHRVRPRQ